MAQLRMMPVFAEFSYASFCCRIFFDMKRRA